jgi:hypothetical protein
MLNHAVSSAVHSTIEDWIVGIVDGTLGLYEYTGGEAKGLLGLVQRPNGVWVELVIGEGLVALCAGRQFSKMIRQLPEVGDQPIEMLITNKRLVPIVERYGAKPLGTLMRFTGD